MPPARRAEARAIGAEGGLALGGGGVVAGGFEAFDPLFVEAAEWCLFFFWDAWLEVAVVEVCGEVLVFGPEA